LALGVLEAETSGPVQKLQARDKNLSLEHAFAIEMFSLTDRSLYAAPLDLWIDSGRRRPRCYVSHGHSDHARPHDTIVLSPASAIICRARFGAGTRRAPTDRIVFEEHPFNQAWDEAEARLTLFPAGHVLGSSQLAIESAAGRFVYTGDFKLARSYTCEPAEIKPCDVLLMECTYGQPRYAFPNRDEIEERLIAFVTDALSDECVPLVLAYSLGKAQEAMAILAKAGLSAAVHSAVATMAAAYEAAGVNLGAYALYDESAYDGTYPLVWPPNAKRPRSVGGRGIRSVMLSGWGLTSGARYRYGVDDVIPLSDHADFPALLRYIEIAAPRKVLLVHGGRDFVWRLRRLGIDAEYLDEHPQLSLF
jgi:Cft2 family RNA processing exonuclease